MRLFIGLPLNPDARKDTAALAAQCRTLIPGRYTLEENYHITLAFLGAVDRERLEDTANVLSRFAARFPAPRITLCGLSYFRQPSNAILIRSVSSPNDLFSMHNALLAQLSEAALPYTDGPFSAHVTLARHADLSLTDPAKLPFQPSAFTAPQAALYLSARDEDGVLRYTPLFSAPFRAQR